MLVFEKEFKNFTTGDKTSFLKGNAFGLFSLAFKVAIDFDFQSDANNLIRIIAANQLQQVNGKSWGDYGVAIGDSLDLTFQTGVGSPTNTTVTVLDVQGNILIHDGTLSDVGELYPSFDNSVFEVENNTRSTPKEIDVFFNLVSNNVQGNKQSLIDGEVNRIKFNVDGMATTNERTGVILGNKSGGSISNAKIIKNANDYYIEFDFLNWLGYLDQPNDKPSIFDANGSIKPFLQIDAYSEFNNPNAVIKHVDNFQNGNVGWINEAYNQGVNNFTAVTVLRDENNNVISELDFTKKTKINIQVAGLTNIKANTCRFTFIHLPTDEDDYKNNQFSNAQNLFTVNYFRENTDNNIIVYGKNSAQFTTSGQTLSISTTNLTFDIELTPNQQLIDYFANREGDRAYMLLIETRSDATDDLVCVLAKFGQMEQAPLFGDVAGEVESLKYLIHPQLASETGVDTLEAYTEDDLLIKGLFKLNKSDNYDAINLSFRVVRQSDGAFFNLWSRNIGAGQFPLTTDNKRLFNYEENLGYNLPNAGRNVLSLKFNGTEDSNVYEVELRHTLLLSWRYWIAKPNALANFLNINLPNNGLNDEWVRYAQTGFDFTFTVEFVKDGVTDFFNAPITIKTYDDSPVISALSLEDGSGNPLPAILSNQDVTIVAEHDNNVNWNQSNTWGWIAIRPFENEPRRLISTRWNWSSLNSPLKPLSGQNEAELTFPSADVAEIKAQIQAGQVSGKNTIVTRIGSPDFPLCTSIIAQVFTIIRLDLGRKPKLERLQTLLNEGIAIPKPNGYCCPPCEDAPLFAFGKSEVMDDVSTIIDFNDLCCLDVYQFNKEI
jgi:hypothetical protein